MNFKNLVRSKLPTLFSMLKVVYHFTRRLIEKSYVGPMVNSFFWRFWRPSVLVSDGFNIQSSDYPHRTTLVSLLNEIPCAKSLLDVGCGFGANIININSSLPELNIVGLDINPRMLEQLKLFIRQNRLKNIKVQKHNLIFRLPFDDNSVDVIIADAVLMFIPNSKIDFVLSEFVRVSKKAIIIHDFCDRKASESSYCGGRWVHNYFKRLARISDNITINERQTEFAGTTWSRFGKFIIIKHY